MKTKLLLATAAFLCLAVQLRGQTPPPYSATDLGTLGIASFAYGINNSGQVVGYSYASDGPPHAFLYSGGSLNDLGTFGGERQPGLRDQRLRPGGRKFRNGY